MSLAELTGIHCIHEKFHFCFSFGAIIMIQVVKKSEKNHSETFCAFVFYEVKKDAKD